MNEVNVRDLTLDDVWSFLCPQSQTELRATEAILAERFTRTCRLGCVQYYGNRTSPDGRWALLHYPFDPRNNFEPKADSVVVDLRFSTFDVSSTFANEMIETYDFPSLRARRLTVTGMLHLTAIGDDYLAYSEVEIVAFSGDKAPQLHSVGHRFLADCKSLTSVVSFEALPSLQSVGDKWLCACESLPSASFAGLTSLKTVGEDWLARSCLLADVSFEGLPSMKTVAFL